MSIKEWKGYQCHYTSRQDEPERAGARELDISTITSVCGPESRVKYKQ